MGSHHFPIFFNLQVERNYYKKTTFKLYTIKTDWDKFTNILENKYENFLDRKYDNAPPSEKYKVYIGIIEDAMMHSTPGKLESMKKQNIPNDNNHKQKDKKKKSQNEDQIL